MPPDRLSALPDELLQHVLGFLPAHEAVRTCVLARRWRPLWKSVRRLHIICPMNNVHGVSLRHHGSCAFINALFLMRACASLDEVKFDYRLLQMDKTDIWIRHALLCQAQSIIVGVNGICDSSGITLGDSRLVSRHLRKLELKQVSLEDRFLDFTSCPALETLEISRCEIGTERIVSPSVKLLHINSSYFMNHYWTRTRISVPSLVCLQLNDILDKAPLLESMPLLETASVKPTSPTDYCRKGDQWDYCGSCAACCGEDDHKGRCVILGGLSSVVNLELTTKPGMCLFKRDLRWCPTFPKLKTLMLNDMCVAFDMSALVCILNHSPVLENLTLYVQKGPELPREREENDTFMEKPAALSRRLKMIKIKCEDFDYKVYDVLKYLTAWGIEVTINRTAQETADPRRWY